MHFNFPRRGMAKEGGGERTGKKKEERKEEAARLIVSTFNLPGRFLSLDFFKFLLRSGPPPPLAPFLVPRERAEAGVARNNGHGENAAEVCASAEDAERTLPLACAPARPLLVSLQTPLINGAPANKLRRIINNSMN